MQNYLEDQNNFWGKGKKPFRIVRDQAANGKKGVRQFYDTAPPWQEYEGNNCVCHVLDREVKTTLADGVLGPLFSLEHKIVAYFKKSNKAGRALHDQQLALLTANPNYWQERLDSLGWNAPTSIIFVTKPKRTLKPILSVPVRWWSQIDENVRFILLEEAFVAAIALVRADLKKRGKKEKADLVKIKERDLLALRKMAAVTFPIKSAIKELEGTSTFYYAIYL